MELELYSLQLRADFHNNATQRNATQPTHQIQRMQCNAIMFQLLEDDNDDVVPTLALRWVVCGNRLNASESYDDALVQTTMLLSTRRRLPRQISALLFFFWVTSAVSQKPQLSDVPVTPARSTSISLQLDSNTLRADDAD